MSNHDGNPTHGEMVLLEIAERAPIANILRQYFKSNPQFVTYRGENAHGVWVQVQDITLKGQTSSKTNDRHTHRQNSGARPKKNALLT